MLHPSAARAADARAGSLGQYGGWPVAIASTARRSLLRSADHAARSSSAASTRQYSLEALGPGLLRRLASHRASASHSEVGQQHRSLAGAPR